MALQKAIKTHFGFECPEAYIMITSANCDYLNERVWLNVSTYVDVNARLEKASPIMTDEYHIYNGQGQEGVTSKYHVYLNTILKDSGKGIVLDLLGDNTQVITLVEGTDFIGFDIEGMDISVDGEIDSVEKLYIVGSMAKDLVELLNMNEVFNAHYVASIFVNGLVIESKYKDIKYNNLNVSGSGIDSNSLECYAVNVIIGNYTKYFAEEVITVEGVSGRSSAYDYLKTLDAYKDCTDV